MRCKHCGKSTSRSGKLFNQTSLNDHIRNKHFHPIQRDAGHDRNTHIELVDDIAGDESDGVYHAIAFEMGLL